MLNILALETSTDACSVALSKNDVVTSRYEIAPREHAKRLSLMVDDLLLSNRITIREIDLIAYGIGPGSFTGLRIGASAAQALAFALKVPVFGGCTLECQALNALQSGIIEPSDYVLSLIDAKIKKIYWSLILFEDNHPVTVFGPEATTIVEFPWDQVLASLQGRHLQVVGDAADLLMQDKPVTTKVTMSFFNQARPHAKSLLNGAISAHDSDQLQDARDVNPLYLDGTSSFKKMGSAEGL